MTNPPPADGSTAGTPFATPTLLITPLRPAVPLEGGAIEVLLRVQAPGRAPESAGTTQQRIPLRLSLVVDRSGSMAGEPLAEALHCVEHIGELLHPEDWLAVVLYDDKVQVPMPMAPSPGGQAVALALAGVESGGSTDLHAGWETGARQLAAGAPGSISRVLLLSDGQANHGLVDVAAITTQCAQWLERGVSTTTVGLGRGFNEELMVAMAHAGGGQQYYGQKAEDLFDAFDEELSLLQAMLLRQLRIKPIAGQGVIVEPLGAARAGAHGWLPLPDLAWGAEAWMLLRLHVTPHAPVGPAGRTLLALSMQGMDMEGNAVALHGAPLQLPVLPAAQVAALPTDETVSRRLQEVGFADLTMQVRQLLQQGKSAEAKALLQRGEAMVANYPWLAGKLAQLKALLERDAKMAAKEMLFSSRKMVSRLSSDDEVMAMQDETGLTTKAAFLRRKVSEGTGRRRST